MGDDPIPVAWEDGDDPINLGIDRAQYGAHPILDGSVPYAGIPTWERGDPIGSVIIEDGTP